jgi:hypothetical protein
MRETYCFIYLGFFFVVLPLAGWIYFLISTRNDPYRKKYPYWERFVDTFTGNFNNKMNYIRGNHIKKMDREKADKIMEIIAKHQDEEGVLYEFCWYCKHCVGDYCTKHDVFDPYDLCVSWSPKYPEMFEKKEE